MPGVNLGGWLVLEKWITPSLFRDSGAEDEYSLMMRQDSAKKIDLHRKGFITEKDFVWLKDHYIEAVRIPIGYWLFEETPPYQTGAKYLDWAFDMADKYGIRILLSLHGAPGSQNGKDHSGRKGEVRWYEQHNRELTKRFLVMISERYRSRDSFWGISILNEPKARWLWDDLRLWWWTSQTLKHLKQRFPHVEYMYSDAFSPRKWSGIQRAAMDLHHYQCFSPIDKARNLNQHIQHLDTLRSVLRDVTTLQPVVIGEWSAALDGKSLHGVPRHESERRYVRAQLDAFEQAEAWFYWNYKTEDDGSWNFRSVMKRGIFEK